MRIAPFNDAPDRKLIGRDTWHAQMRDFVNESEDGIGARAVLQRVGADGTAVETFHQLLVQQTNTVDSEATQQILASEGEKIYAFDRTVMILVVTGFVHDSDFGEPLTRAGSDFQFTGKGLSEWKRFYEDGRISRLARSGERIRLELGDQVYTGAFVDNAVNGTANDPMRVDIVVNLLVANVEMGATGAKGISDIQQLASGENRVRGSLTLEGAVRVGLLDTPLELEGPAGAIAAAPPATTVPGAVVRQPERPAALSPTAPAGPMLPSSLFGVV